MIVYLSKVLPQFILPAGLAAILLFLSLFLIKKKPKTAIWLVLISLLLVSAAGNAYFSTFLARSLEWRYMPLTGEVKADAIVLLGGGTEAPDTPRQMVELNSAGDRVLYAAQLYKAGAAPLIILSGGNVSYSQARGSTPAEEMQAVLVNLGVPQEALILQKQSQNTAEDAFFTGAILAEKQIRTVILVTSAAHMERALMMFASPEINIIPAPTDYSVTQRSWDELMRWDWKTVLTHVMPDGGTLGQTNLILHEYLGIFFYRVKFLWDSQNFQLPSLSGLLPW
ncbi:MAG: YdcF family protein [Anaerolineaceae bacterium]